MVFPVTVDAVNYASGRDPSRAGPFAVGASGTATRYLIQVGNNAPQGGVNTLGAWKSLDFGATWSIRDEINAPLCGVFPASDVYSASYDGSRFIWVIFQTLALLLKAVAYDTLTDKWGVPISSGITSAPTGLAFVTTAYRKFDNKVGILFLNGSVVDTGVTYDLASFLTFTPLGATWSAQTALGHDNTLDVAEQIVQPHRMIEGAGGLMHCELTQYLAAGANVFALMFQSVNVAGVAGTQQTLIFGSAGFPSFPLTNTDMVFSSPNVTLCFCESLIAGQTRITRLIGASVLNVVFGAPVLFTFLMDPTSCMFALAVNGAGVIDMFVAGNTGGPSDFFRSASFGAFVKLGTGISPGGLLNAVEF